jgi:8-oxo-dGTP pyrophosphatase MutT (NUDIX family)
MIAMEEIRRRLAEFEAEEIDVTGRRQAAVALILREREAGPEVLFIERAQREGDPWSGHMAFPGGRLEPQDPHIRATAERETAEEIGLSLADAEHLGHLGDVLGNPRVQTDLVISAHAYEVPPEVPPLTLEQAEVADALWFPVAQLHDPERHVHFSTPPLRRARFPGIEVGVPERQVVWGLTYRFLDIFFEALGRPLPDRWGGLGRPGGR